MATQQLPSLLLQLINAESEAKRKEVIERHADLLLTDEATRLLADWLEQSKGNAEYVRVLEECRALLARCREMGIEAAFANVSPHPPGQTSSHASFGELARLFVELQRLTRPGDMSRRIELCHRALRLVVGDNQPQLWAALQNELGSSYAQNPLGERADNLEQAISSYQQALKVYTRPALPVEWAATMNNLALALHNRIKGERADNIEQAITCYRQVLEIRTRQALPVEWAKTINNLANAYFERIKGERADNYEQAISCYQQALCSYNTASPARRMGADDEQPCRSLLLTHQGETCRQLRASHQVLSASSRSQNAAGPARRMGADDE